MIQLQRINEMTAPPVVGKRYLVPCVHYIWLGRRSWWPTIGPKHEDTEILNFPWRHYHVDGRFLTQYQRQIADRYSYNRDWQYQVSGCPLSYGAEEPPDTVTYRPLTCTSQAVDYPFETAQADWRPKLVEAYDHQRLRRDANGVWICPHRGAPLGSIKPDECGVITCPLHGLRWCAATGLPQ